MSAPQPPADSRRRSVLVVLFWVGVGLAPIAALLLLLAQGSGSLRMAAVLAVLAVVLIGLSIALRGDAETVRLDMEETLLGEIDTLREDLRNDIATAARATHRAFGEKLQVVQDNLEALRGQVGGGRVDAPRAGHERAGYERGGYEHGEAPAPPPVAPNMPTAQPASVGHYGVPSGQHGMVGHQQPAPGPAGDRASVPVAPVAMPHPPVSGALVRHTETVHVTTRHTIVDHAEQPNGGKVYGAGVYGGHHAEPSGGERDGERGSKPSRGRRASEADEDPWGDQLRPEPPGGEGRRPWSHEDGPADDDRWSGMRAGDRWASLRSDERGRELRMGERRAAVHADESGTEMHIEDRWTAVRREEPRGRWRDGGGRHDDDSGWRTAGWEARDDGGDWDRPSGRAALPAGGVEQPASWGQGWAEPEREPVHRGRRYRDDEGYGYPPADDAPRAGRAYRVDYEYPDDRWG